MDIEGGEPSAIKGMFTTINEQKNLSMIMEYYPDALMRAYKNPEIFLQDIKNLGLTINVIAEEGKTKPADEFLTYGKLHKTGYYNLLLRRQ